MKKIKAFLIVLFFAITMPALAQSDSSSKILDKAHDIVKDRDDDRRDREKYDHRDREKYDRRDREKYDRDRNRHDRRDGKRHDDRKDKRYDKRHDDRKHDRHHHDRDKKRHLKDKKGPQGKAHGYYKNKGKGNKYKK